MILGKDKVQIDVPPAVVWNYLEDADLMKLWNPKIRQVTTMSWDQKKGPGFRYGIMYEMSGKASELLAEFVEHQPPKRLVIKHTGGKLPRDSFAEEIYELSESNGGTLLKQTIVMHNAKINIILRALIACIIRFGKPMGKPYLVLLKELIETNEKIEKVKGERVKGENGRHFQGNPERLSDVEP